MQAWWAEENSLKNIKNLTVQKLLTGSVLCTTIFMSQNYIIKCMDHIFVNTVLKQWNISSRTYFCSSGSVHCRNNRAYSGCSPRPRCGTGIWDKHPFGRHRTPGPSCRCCCCTDRAGILRPPRVGFRNNQGRILHTWHLWVTRDKRCVQLQLSLLQNYILHDKISPNSSTYTIIH